MRINYNVSAMLSNNALANSDSLLAKSLERLSSGLKINHAKDNPAGLAMSKRMNAQLKGLAAANQNSSDGVSIIETADGALSEVSSMLQRINELSVKACNGTMTDEDRKTIQAEVQQLKDEITRISETTEFNGQKLLDGKFTTKGYTSTEEISVNSYSENAPSKVYTITDLTVSEELDEDGNPTGNLLLDDITLGDGFPVGMKNPVLEDNILTLEGENGFYIKLDLNETSAGSYSDLETELTGIGAMRLQVGSNEGQILAINIPEVSLRNLGIENIDLSTEEGANDALERMDNAISFVSSVRGKLGAYQNRLETSINSLDITSENMTSAYSRIMDVDMAEEMTSYTTYQIMTQAGTSMLAQANERPSQVLQLLQ